MKIPVIKIQFKLDYSLNLNEFIYNLAPIRSNYLYGYKINNKTRTIKIGLFTTNCKNNIRYKEINQEIIKIFSPTDTSFRILNIKHEFYGKLCKQLLQPNLKWSYKITEEKWNHSFSS